MTEKTPPVEDRFEEALLDDILLRAQDDPDFAEDIWAVEQEREMLDRMDEALDEDFAARSPYRGMTRAQREAYDLAFHENEVAGHTNLGDILRAAMEKKK